MRIAIMQPYFMPYIGYFQLIAAVDMFVVYDNVKYTKSGWINRNRFLLNGKDATFSLPLRKDSDALNVVERHLSTDFDRRKLLDRISGAYRRAPYFPQTLALLDQILDNTDTNLFRYIQNSIAMICKHLGITTAMKISSHLEIDHTLAKQSKVLAICRDVGADTYINPVGGIELYSHEEFKRNQISLKFLRSLNRPYTQFGEQFVPWLSILDIMMFNSPGKISDMIRHDYELI